MKLETFKQTCIDEDIFEEASKIFVEPEPSMFKEGTRHIFVGPSKSGKDAACLALDPHFPGSNSKAIWPYFVYYKNLYGDPIFKELHNDVSASNIFYRKHRHKYAMEIYHFCNRYRRDDPAKLVKLTLVNTPLISGVRGREELVAAAKIVDHIWWIHRDVPDDPTLEFNTMFAVSQGAKILVNKFDRLAHWQIYVRRVVAEQS